jgi:hypothetical protein
MTTPTLTQAQAQEAVELLRAFVDKDSTWWVYDDVYEEGVCRMCFSSAAKSKAPENIRHDKDCPVARTQVLLATIESESE